MALYSRVKVWVSNEVLTASDLNAEFDNEITNAKATSVVGYSVDTSQMQTTADPYPAASVSLAGSVAEEITRLRYVIKQITGESQWYVDPTRTLATGALAVAAADIAANAVTTAKILDDNVTADKLADGCIDAAAKLASNVVTTAKINAAAVTAPKLATLNRVLSTTSGGFTRTANTYAGVVACAITVVARPVRIYFVPDGTDIGYFDVGSGGTGMTLRITRDAADIGRVKLSAVGAHAPSVFSLIDDPGAGSYTYTCYMLSNDNTTLMGFYFIKMVVEEIA